MTKPAGSRGGCRVGGREPPGVRDYDKAIAFYRDALGFDLVEDTHRGDGSRWVVVRPR
ncbi:VOC family protein, partial [Streptomyces californicus]|uniref:VOC family protein n=1 Tax=Streptomyces californicus TaxID=67351 RepID=UPI0033F8580F